MTTNHGSENPATFLERDEWMRAILAADLPHAAVRVAVRIALHLHVKTGRCDPVCKTLAEESGIGERSIYRIIALLERCGWVGIERTKGRNANRYTLRNPDTAMAVLNPDTAMAVSAPSTLPNQAPQPCQSSVNPTLPYAGRPKAKRTTKRTEKRRKTLSPDVASLGVKKASKGLAAGRVKPEAAPSGTLRCRDAKSANRDAETADAFPRFWAVYPNHQNEKLARKAFARAEIDNDPEIIIAGGQRYALAQQLRLSRPGQTPQHTAHAHNWLEAERWNDPPPPGLVVDEAGHPLAIEPDEEEDTRDVLERVMAEAPQLWPDWKDGQ